MYIPIMKNRNEETRVSKVCSSFFSDEVVPLFEIIQDKYIKRYEVDETGEYKYEIKPGNIKKSKIELIPKEEDIITLDEINKNIEGKKAFIDFFRFFESEYGRNRNFKNIETSILLSRNFNYYRSRILQIAKFKNFIPTISIKKGLEISIYDLTILVNDIRKLGSSVALRITADFLDTYLEFIEENLYGTDYVMLDIREDSMNSKIMEIEDFETLNFSGKKILLNSPRKRSMQNKEFGNLNFTTKIDNSVSEHYKDFHFDGFGDFGGLKDDLPTDIRSSRGAALALLFFKEYNKFYSIVNEDTSLGVSGYDYVKQEVIKRKNFFDPDNTCLGMAKIKELKKNGNFATWNNVNLTRYIQLQASK